MTHASTASEIACLLAFIAMVDADDGACVSNGHHNHFGFTDTYANQTFATNHDV
jgi:hypothetical protein